MKKTKRSQSRVGIICILCIITNLFCINTGWAETPQENNAEAILQIADAPIEVPLSPRFKLEARTEGGEWQNVPVYLVSTVERGFVNEKAGVITDAGTASFACSGHIDIKVTSLDEKVEKVRIRPDKLGIDFEQDGNTIIFSVDKPEKLVIDFNDKIFNNLMLFMNEPEEVLIEKYNIDFNDPDVIYFAPGFHTSENNPNLKHDKNGNCDILNIETGKTVYLAPGAVVQAYVTFTEQVAYNNDFTPVLGAKDARFLGYGIIYQRPYNTVDGLRSGLPIDGETNSINIGISISYCDGIVIDGITLINPGHYGIGGGQSKNIKINNYKGMDAMIWGDGIDMMSCSNVDISNSFVRSSDDSIAIYADRWGYKGDSENWNITNCLLFCDWARTINIGSHGSMDPENRRMIQNINIKDCTLMYSRSGEGGKIQFSCADENYMKDITIENIDIEDCASSALITMWVKETAYSPSPGYRIEDVILRNINFNEETPIVSSSYGYSDDRIISGVKIENLTVAGKPIVDPEDANMIFGDYMEDVTFTHDDIPGTFKPIYSAIRDTTSFELSDLVIEKAANEIIIDGNDDDWKNTNTEKVHITSTDNVTTEEDCSMDVRLAYDEEYLYIFADVTDDVIITKETNRWNADAIQFAFERDGVYSSEIMINALDDPTMGSNGKFEGKRPISDIKVKSRERLGGIKYEMAVPWESVLNEKPDESFVFNIMYNEADVKDREGWIEWTTGIGSGKTTAAFKVIGLKKESAFEDIENHWAEEDIKKMVLEGVVKGTDKCYFTPDENVTRAEFLVMLYRAAKFKRMAYKGGIDDVTADDWFANHVGTAAHLEIIPNEMLLDNCFKPNEPITREEMAYLTMRTYLMKTKKIVDKDIVSFTDDAEISDWARNAVSEAVTLGVIKGTDNGKFAPQSALTRAEAATVASRLYDFIWENE